MEKTIKWLENYWYHYKWVTIITVSSLIALCVCLFQCSAKDKYDMYLLYAGPYYIGIEQNTAIIDAVNDHMENEKQGVCVNNFTYVSKETQKKYDQEGIYYNIGANAQQREDFLDFLYTANFNMIVLDPELYSMIDSEKLLTPLAEISDKCADASFDGYAIHLYDTSLPSKYKVFSEMPEDTVICFRKNVLIQNLSSKNNKETYNYHTYIFKKIIEDNT